MTNNISVNVGGDISKPADTLIRKLYDAGVALLAPWQIKRVAKAKGEAVQIKAKADVEADLIKTKGEIEISDLQRRAIRRVVEEEARRQENMETIVHKALPLLKEDSDPSKMDDDWITNFFDKSRIVSDDQMQELWSRILAGEANSPSSFSKRTVNALADFDKSDAELFTNLCNFGWIVTKFSPLIFDTAASIYGDKGLNFSSLTHLDSIGLVNFNHLAGFINTNLPKTFAVSYFGKPLTLTMPKEKDGTLNIGLVRLTHVGLELASICQGQEVAGFFDYVKEKWKKYLPNDKTDL